MDKNLENLHTAIRGLHWFKRWFLPSKLITALEAYRAKQSPQTQLEAYQAFAKTSSFIKWLFSCLSNFKQSAGARGYVLLEKLQLLNRDNLSTLLAHSNLDNVLGHLSTSKSMSQSSFGLLVNTSATKPFRIPIPPRTQTTFKPDEHERPLSSSSSADARQSFYPNSNSTHTTPDSAVVVTTPESVVLMSTSSVPPSSASGETTRSSGSDSDVSNASRSTELPGGESDAEQPATVSMGGRR